jgi:hypothetical protein
MEDFEKRQMSTFERRHQEETGSRLLEKSCSKQKGPFGFIDTEAIEAPWSVFRNLEPILRLPSLQLQRRSCSRLERFFTIEENNLFSKRTM